MAIMADVSVQELHSPFGLAKLYETDQLDMSAAEYLAECAKLANQEGCQPARLTIRQGFTDGAVALSAQAAVLNLHDGSPQQLKNALCWALGLSLATVKSTDCNCFVYAAAAAVSAFLSGPASTQAKGACLYSFDAMRWSSNQLDNFGRRQLTSWSQTLLNNSQPGFTSMNLQQLLSECAMEGCMIGEDAAAVLSHTLNVPVTVLRNSSGDSVQGRTGAILNLTVFGDSSVAVADLRCCINLVISSDHQHWYAASYPACLSLDACPVPILCHEAQPGTSFYLIPSEFVDQDDVSSKWRRLGATLEGRTSGPASAASAAAQEVPGDTAGHGMRSQADVLLAAAQLSQRITNTEAELTAMRAELQRLLQLAGNWQANNPADSATSSNTTADNDAAIAAALEHSDEELVKVESVPFAMECVICMTEVNDQAQLAIVDGCGHPFHGECLAQFLNSDPAVVMDESRAVPVCPACKADMPARQATAVTRLLIGEMQEKQFLSEIEVRRLDHLMVRTALGPESGMCSCINCSMLFQVETFTQEGELIESEGGIRINPNQVMCPQCHVSQCARCGVAWDTHQLRSCREYQAATHVQNIDPETRRLLDAEVVRCPGPCGQGLSKVEHTCNVLKCMSDRIYVCALCGAKLDSSDFNPQDYAHARASKHYQEQGTPCYNSLFTPRAEWLRQHPQQVIAPAAAIA